MIIPLSLDHFNQPGSVAFTQHRETLLAQAQNYNREGLFSCNPCPFDMDWLPYR
jgi:hypothetical protein